MPTSRVHLEKPAAGGWALPIGLALAVGALMVWAADIVRVPSANKEKISSPTVPALDVTRLDWLPAGGEVRERLRLLDPTPLFMPGMRMDGVTSWPDGQEGRPSGDAGARIPAALIFPDQRPTREILRPSLPATPLAAADGVLAPRWFAGMARTEARPRTDLILSRSTGGRMDVYRSGVAERMVSIELPTDALLESTMWSPVEMTVLIDEVGVVAPPKVASGSGVGEVDERIRTLAKRDLLPRLLLRPGSYRLVIGP